MHTQPSATTTTINVNGTSVFVSIRRGDGSEPPLLLLNGIGANLEVFDLFIQALDKAAGKQIGTIRFDVPGVGGSPPSFWPLRSKPVAGRLNWLACAGSMSAPIGALLRCTSSIARAAKRCMTS